MQRNLPLFFASILLFVAGNALPTSELINKGNIECESIVVFYEGIFQRPEDDSQSFYAQFQVKIYTSPSEQRVYLGIENWNQSAVTTDAVVITMITDTEWKRCYALNQPCWISFDSASKYFTFALRHEYPRYEFFIFQVNSSNSGFSFTLPSSLNGCTNVLPAATLRNNVAQNQADPTLYRGCGCCGDYRPDAYLNCPAPSKSHT